MKRVSLFVNIVAVVSLLSGGLLWTVVILKSGGYNEQYQFRLMALLSLSAAMINTMFMGLLYKRIKSSESGLLFLTHIGCLVLWSLSEFMQRISSDVGVADLWRNTAIFAWAFMSMPYFLFVLSYIEKQIYARKYLLIIGFFAVFSGFILAELHSNLLISNDYVLKPWGWDSANTDLMNVFAIWNMTVFLTAATLLTKDYRVTLSKQKRTQIKIFIFSLSIPLIGGTTTDLILPNVFHVDAWPMAAFLVGTAGAILSFAIYKYGLFSLNPASLSSEIIATLPQPVIGTDNKCEIQFLNTNAEKMFSQYAPFRGKNIKSFVGSENYINIQKAISKMDRNTDTVTVEKMPLGLNEGVIIAQTQIRRVGQGELEGYIFAMSNITQQVLTMKIIEKEVKVRTQLYNEEKARLLSSVNGMRQGFLITDDDGKIILMNEKAQDLFKSVEISSVEHGHVVSSGAEQIIDKTLEGFNFIEKVKRVIENKKFVEFEGYELGSLIFDIEVLPVSDNKKIIGVAVLFDDVTERTLVERSKDEFFSIASHELRTPLTAIRGNTSMILNYYNKQLKDPELKEMVGDIHESSLRLIEIVNDFLDTSRLEQDRMTFEFSEFSIEKVINEVIKETSLVAEERNNKLEFKTELEDLPTIYADRNKTKEIIYNLVGNSIKFTENGKVTVLAEIEARHIKISVVDTGRGISEEMERLLFRKFQQAGPSLITRDTTKGTGLGLYISRLMIEKMNGQIDLVASEPGRGSTFCFTLPIAKQGVDVVK